MMSWRGQHICPHAKALARVCMCARATHAQPTVRPIRNTTHLHVDAFTLILAPAHLNVKFNIFEVCQRPLGAAVAREQRVERANGVLKVPPCAPRAHSRARACKCE